MSCGSSFLSLRGPPVIPPVIPVAGLVLNLCPAVMNEVLRHEVAAPSDEPGS